MTGSDGSEKKAVPTAAQKRWLQRGLDQAGGKLPLFDDEGRQISVRTIRSCVAAGWAEPWFSNPIKPDWLVCRLTAAGAKAAGSPKTA
ncbi:MAG: hypothetical protein ABJD74_20260, partial [Roseibium sp.]